MPNDEAPLPIQRSWLDRLLHVLETLPVPLGLVYLTAAAAGAVTLQVLLWACGSLAWGRVSVQALATGSWTFLTLGALHLAFTVGRGSLEAFRPLLSPGREALARALRLDSVSTLSTVVAGALGALYTWALQRADPTFFGLAGARACNPIVFSFGWLNSSSILLIVWTGARVLAEVHRLHQQAPHINVFDRRPLFAFSRLTSTIAILTVALSYLFYLAFPMLTRNPVAYGFILVFNFPLAIAAFVLPLYGMHQRITAEKQERLADVSLRLQAVVHTLHERMEKSRLEDVEQLNVLLAALLNEEGYLRTIPSWPWEPGALTGVLTAILLPLVLFAAQRLIEQLLIS